jgi:O-antigen ligase
MQHLKHTMSNRWQMTAAILLAAIPVSCVFNLMKINSLAIILVVAFSLVVGWGSRKNIKLDFFKLSYLLYFAVIVSALIHTSNFSLELKNIESKLSLLILPFAFALLPFKSVYIRQLVLLFTTLAVLVSSIICLIFAGIYWTKTGDTSHFFYHEFLTPLKHHAVFYSIFVFISLMFFLIETPFINSIQWLKKIKWGIILYLLLLLFVLSSKMVIVISFLLLPAIYLKRNDWKRWWWIPASLLVVAIVGLSYKNSISSRFHDLLDTNFTMLKSDVIGKGEYLNGLEFRLLQWRNTYEILNNKEAWWFGLTFSETNKTLYEQYDALQLYGENTATGKTGYYLYDTHNQFLQTTLEYGILGLLLLLIIYIAIVRLAVLQKDKLLFCLAVIFITFSFTDTILERQYGMVLFVFLPLLLQSAHFTPKSKTEPEG